MKKPFVGITLLLVAVMVGCGNQVDLEKVKEQLEANNKQIRQLTLENDSLMSMLDTAKTSANGITVSVKYMRPERFVSYLGVLGTVEAVHDAFISPEMGGQIKVLHVKEGDRVSQGDLLVELNTSVIDKSIAELTIRYELAKDVFEKQRMLWVEKQIGSEMEFKQAKNNKDALEKSIAGLQAQRNLSVIKAPFNGIVDEMFLKVGEMAAPGMRLIQLVNLSELYVNAEVSEKYIANIGQGDLAEVTFPSLPGEGLQTRVTRVSNVINPVNRTFKVQLRFRNTAGRVKPNMVANLRFVEYENDSAFVLPSLVVKTDNIHNKKFIFMAVGQEDKLVARKMLVQEVKTFNSISEISGISAGDRVIIEGDVTTGSVVVVDNTKSMYESIRKQ